MYILTYKNYKQEVYAKEEKQKKRRISNDAYQVILGRFEKEFSYDKSEEAECKMRSL